jgi:hypothetical protein
MPTTDLIKFNLGSGSNRAEMLCPRCGSDYLHHQSITSFDRSEDAQVVVETTVLCGEAKMKSAASSASRNPSARRDGLEIVFTCEGCEEGRSLSLFISQHKGQTEVFWEY